jgi:hypothetical protein
LKHTSIAAGCLTPPQGPLTAPAHGSGGAGRMPSSLSPITHPNAKPAWRRVLKRTIASWVLTSKHSTGGSGGNGTGWGQNKSGGRSSESEKRSLRYARNSVSRSSGRAAAGSRPTISVAWPGGSACPGIPKQAAYREAKYGLKLGVRPGVRRQRLGQRAGHIDERCRLDGSGAYEVEPVGGEASLGHFRRDHSPVAVHDNPAPVNLPVLSDHGRCVVVVGRDGQGRRLRQGALRGLRAPETTMSEVTRRASTAAATIA